MKNKDPFFPEKIVLALLQILKGIFIQKNIITDRNSDLCEEIKRLKNGYNESKF